MNYIAQELTPKDISESDILNILNIIYILLSSENDEEVIEVTINAFSDYIPFSKKSFENSVLLINSGTEEYITEIDFFFI